MLSFGLQVHVTELLQVPQDFVCLFLTPIGLRSILPETIHKIMDNFAKHRYDEHKKPRIVAEQIGTTCRLRGTQRNGGHNVSQAALRGNGGECGGQTTTDRTLHEKSQQSQIQR